jgi:hypothetical protein
MKTLSICAVILFSIFSSSTIIAQKAGTKESIKVWGNCGMCKKTIEKSAKSAGATTANWDEETHVLTVAYSPAKTSNQKIQQSIANSGYDTQDLKADNKAYDNLHGCCKYDRKDAAAATKEATACCDDAACGKDASTCKDMAGCKDKACCKM